jgi:uncharacterized protein (TIRG00374 family)
VLLRVVVSVVAVAGCAWWASKQSAPTFPGDARGFALLAAAIGVYAVNTAFRGLRWDAILRGLRIGHRRADAFALLIVGYMGNTVLPARGGEVLRILLLAERSSARRLEVLGSIVTERLLDGAALAAVFCALSLAGVAGAPVGVGWAIAAGVALVAAVVGLRVYVRMRRAGRFERLAARIRPVARASRFLVTARGARLAVATVGLWFGEGLVMMLVAHAVGLHLGWASATLVVVVASLASLIPALPGYVGTLDAALLFMFHHVGVKGGNATGLLLLYRFVLFVPITAAGLALLVGRYGAGGLLRRREPARAAIM